MDPAGEGNDRLAGGPADRLARQCGFVRGQRKVSGSHFAQALVFAALAESQPTGSRLRGMAALLGLQASRQAITKRLDARAARFLPMPMT